MDLHKLHSTQTRALGRTALQPSLLGFGAAPIGNLYHPVSDELAISGVRRALELGIRYFDTAPHYGFGLSEQRLGSALSGETAPLISSKVGRVLVPTDSAAPVRHGFAGALPLEPVFDYSYQGVMRTFEASLQRLRRETIDILLVHDLGEYAHGRDHGARFREFLEGGYAAMHELRASGRVAAIGLGANEWQVCNHALGHCDFDCFLLAGRYTLLEQDVCEEFLPRCAHQQVSVILGGPFNSGILATGVSGSGPHYYNYEPAPAEIIERVRHLEEICREFEVPLAAAALQFPAAHPHICSVVAGLVGGEQVEQAVELMNLTLPRAFWQTLRELGLIHPEAPVPVYF
jgi:D-threo-aldose 1-dehydrogenase